MNTLNEQKLWNKINDLEKSRLEIAGLLEKSRIISDQYKAERDTLIDDLSWYKAKVSRLEQRHSKLVDENTRLQNELYTVGLNQDEAGDKIKEYKTLLSEISQHIGNKPSSSSYKYFRAKLDGIGIKEGE